jgi:tetratricopeptide (TPR) repeat protein
MLQSKDREGAIAQFEKVVRENRNDPTAFLAIASVAQQMREWQLSRKYAEAGLAANPNAPNDVRAQLLTVASVAALFDGDVQGAVQHAEAAYKLLPNHPMTLNGLGYTYAEMYAGDTPEGVAKLREAEKLIMEAIQRSREMGQSEENVGIIVDSLGWVYFKLGDFKRAVLELGRAALMAPDQAEILYHLGVAQMKVDRFAEAVTTLNRALRVDPRFMPAQTALTEARARLEEEQQKVPPGKTDEEDKGGANGGKEGRDDKGTVKLGEEPTPGMDFRPRMSPGPGGAGAHPPATENLGDSI